MVKLSRKKRTKLESYLRINNFKFRDNTYKQIVPHLRPGTLIYLPTSNKFTAVEPFVILRIRKIRKQDRHRIELLTSNCKKITLRASASKLILIITTKEIVEEKQG